MSCPFIPQSLENRAAIRTAISTLTAILIAFALHLDKPYWAGMTVVILANIYTGNIIDKAIMRITGTIIGAWLGYFLAGFIANSFFLYLLGGFSLITIAVYYYNLSRYAYAYLLLAISAFIVISELAFSPGEAFQVAIWRPAEIGLGVIVSAISALFLFPNTIQDAMNKSTNTVFISIDNLLAKIASALQEQNLEMLSAIQKDNLNVKKKLRQGIEMLGFMRREIGFERVKLDQYRLVLESFQSFIRMNSYYVRNNFFMVKENKALIEQFDLQSIFAAIQSDLNYIKSAFMDEQKPEGNLQSPLLIDNFRRRINQLMSAHPGQYQNMLAIAHFLRQLNSMLENMNTVFAGREKPVEIRQRLISHQEQLRNDPDVILHAIKAGLSATLALVFWLISNWPGGLNGIISSIVISVRKSLFEMKSVSLHRILGCLLGGGLALGSLAYFAFNLYDFMLLILIGVWAFSYFSFKRPADAYIGLQANLALVITVAQEGGAPTSLTPPLERLGGIFIGIAASFLVANVLWRTDLWHILLRQIAKLKRHLIHNCKQMLRSEYKMTRPFDLVNQFWLTRGALETLEVEGQTNEKKLAQLQAIHDEYDKLVMMQATLSHIQETVNQQQAIATASQLNLDLNQLAEAVGGLYEEANISKVSETQAELTLAMHKIVEQVGAFSADELENCEVYLQALYQLTVINLDILKIAEPVHFGSIKGLTQH
ncbi:p-hydroxybenzoic acid efflux pump subunit AaeB [Legionella birminghamensis]|uniref:p-hydroxybenzoic acid efflux pump subunit AaeB n=1 Tax=Legionella birminghamensis TaxID=28083 RepID=A0A378I8F8_9GAMM|nr:FUSC family protein [Legionella birminghamensis]KTC68158.1 p-hydroxybenzoic acid efflux pump subunit AaeB [Legionella birminghamensis]STX31132.1 p-hydroxybenzoic acid efflux pump subunit AaeB [Legionella birminghamensis]